ncbi:MAG TPA: SDR family oxidoreductase [Nevskiaceae bacterium]|nr:SDR family oxidoreductase [Nevskiaceae bacterium]
MLVKDKVLIISGIGPGLGVKLAVEAAREGASALAINARTASKLDDAEKRIAEVNPACQVLKQVTDITDKAQCEALAAATVARFGRIDGLLNSAFFHGEMDYASTAELDGWTAVLNTNLLGTLKLTQAVLPQMRKQKSGAIVMINTMAARQVPPLGEAGYAASKGALETASRFLAKEVAKDGIRVNNVYMGWMWGAPVRGYMEFQEQQGHGTVAEMKAQVAASIPMGRIPTDNECARAALFLVSDYASAITGAQLDANGGSWMP